MMVLNIHSDRMEPCFRIYSVIDHQSTHPSLAQTGSPTYFQRMKKHPLFSTKSVFIAFIALFFSISAVSAQDDSRPWERLGLSITEWNMIQENNLPMNKVEELLKAGIGISEYFDQPWITINLTEEEWIGKRRSGMTSYDIELEAKTIAPNSESDDSAAAVNASFQEYDRSAETKGKFAGFFLPGYMQIKRGDKGKGAIMATLAVGSIAGCIGWSITEKNFVSLPLFAVVIPMTWSLIDHSIYRKKNAQ
jgi:hypothetical protein